MRRPMDSVRKASLSESTIVSCLAIEEQANDEALVQFYRIQGGQQQEEFKRSIRQPNCDLQQRIMRQSKDNVLTQGHTDAFNENGDDSIRKRNISPQSQANMAVTTSKESSVDASSHATGETCSSSSQEQETEQNLGDESPEGRSKKCFDENKQTKNCFGSALLAKNFKEVEPPCTEVLVPLQPDKPHDTQSASLEPDYIHDTPLSLSASLDPEYIHDTPHSHSASFFNNIDYVADSDNNCGGDSVSDFTDCLDCPNDVQREIVAGCTHEQEQSLITANAGCYQQEGNGASIANNVDTATNKRLLKDCQNLGTSTNNNAAMGGRFPEEKRTVNLNSKGKSISPGASCQKADTSTTASCKQLPEVGGDELPTISSEEPTRVEPASKDDEEMAHSSSGIEESKTQNASSSSHKDSSTSQSCYDEVCLSFVGLNVSESLAGTVFEEAVRILTPGGLIYVFDLDGSTVSKVPVMRDFLLRLPDDSNNNCRQFDERTAEIMRSSGMGTLPTEDPRISRWLGIKPFPRAIR